MDFVLSYGIQNKTPIFLALKVSFRVVREDIKKTPSYCVGRPDRSGIENGIGAPIINLIYVTFYITNETP